MDQQHQLDSLLQEVCIYDLAHNELKLMGFLVGTYTLPCSLNKLHPGPGPGAGIVLNLV